MHATISHEWEMPKIEADRKFIAEILTGLGKFFFPSAHICAPSVYRSVLTHFRFICIIASFHRMALSLPLTPCVIFIFRSPRLDIIE